MVVHWNNSTFGQVIHREDDIDPLARLAEVVREVRSPQLEELPGFSGGLVGYFGYEIVSHLEPRLDFSAKPDGSGGAGNPAAGSRGTGGFSTTWPDV